ncbi:MAG: alanine racemase C-terminal domain-containing protein [Pelagimonas sp.]|uniref:alanine racemase C-terminal domain-containing protein n=1 Tax=Pelagimonas sp. TaxID=2073170 RepID=UPI003D6A6759
MSDGLIPSAWCDINLDLVAKNLELTLGLLPRGAGFCAVMKADAYGHGIARIVPVLLEQRVTCVGITSNAEARAVRRAGFSGSLIRLRAATLPEMQAALPDLVEEQVGSLLAAKHLGDLLCGTQAPTGIHLALNAGGMSRDGLDISMPSGQETCRKILEEVGPRIHGISTHFPTNDPEPLRRLGDRFQQQVAWICDNSDLNRPDLLVHAGSTLTLLSGQPVATDMFRCGAILYGFLKPELGFRPTMEFKARVVHLGVYPKGATVGYDRDTSLRADSRLACISVGYAAGYNRTAASHSAVLIRGMQAPVLGKVSMNSIVADVTGISAVQVGDTATLFGSDGESEISPAAAVAQFGSILPDLLTDWGMRNPRTYRSGQP